MEAVKGPGLLCQIYSQKETRLFAELLERELSENFLLIFLEGLRKRNHQYSQIDVESENIKFQTIPN